MLKEIKNRRSIRNYKDEKISKEELIDILSSGVLAPSAKNNQPWLFVVVSDEIKSLIVDKMVSLYGKNMTASVIDQVPYLILVYNTSEQYFNHLSIGAAIENILLEATSRNLGTLWIGYIKKIEEYVNSLVDINYELVSAIAIGVKNEEVASRPRKDLDSVLIFK